MSGNTNEDQSCTRVDEKEPTENVREETDVAVERHRIRSPIPSCVDESSERYTSSTFKVEENASTATHSVQVAAHKLLKGHVSQADRGVQVPIERLAPQASGFHVPIERLAPQASGFQVPIERLAPQASGVQVSIERRKAVLAERAQAAFERRLPKAETVVKAAIEKLEALVLSECNVQAAIGAEGGVQVPIEGQSSDPESLVDFLLDYYPQEASNINVPHEKKDFPTRPVEKLPEINVENILKGTRGRRNQSLFPTKSRNPPYRSLTQRMHLDDMKEIVDLTKERKKKKKRFRCKFDDDSTEESSSSSEESRPPKSESSSQELQFQLDL